MCSVRRGWVFISARSRPAGRPVLNGEQAGRTLFVVVMVCQMPVISRFFGIVIAMYWRDHAPPHFHAKYGDEEVTVDIQTGAVTGVMSKRALAMVEEWRVLHVAELLEDLQLAATRQSLRRIDALE